MKWIIIRRVLNDAGAWTLLTCYTLCYIYALYIQCTSSNIECIYNITTDAIRSNRQMFFLKVFFLSFCSRFFFCFRWCAVALSRDLLLNLYNSTHSYKISCTTFVLDIFFSFLLFLPLLIRYYVNSPSPITHYIAASLNSRCLFFYIIFVDHLNKYRLKKLWTQCKKIRK